MYAHLSRQPRIMTDVRQVKKTYPVAVQDHKPCASRPRGSFHNALPNEPCRQEVEASRVCHPLDLAQDGNRLEDASKTYVSMWPSRLDPAHHDRAHMSIGLVSPTMTLPDLSPSQLHFEDLQFLSESVGECFALPDQVISSYPTSNILQIEPVSKHVNDTLIGLSGAHLFSHVADPTTPTLSFFPDQHLPVAADTLPWPVSNSLNPSKHSSRPTMAPKLERQLEHICSSLRQSGFETLEDVLLLLHTSSFEPGSLCSSVQQQSCRAGRLGKFLQQLSQRSWQWSEDEQGAWRSAVLGCALRYAQDGV